MSMDPRLILLIADPSLSIDGDVTDGLPSSMRIQASSPAGMDGLLPEASAILTVGAGLEVDCLRRAERCVLIVHAGTGSGGVDLETARELGIPVISIPDGATEELAALTLETLDRFLDDSLSARSLPTHCPPRLGLVGLGQVGRTVARAARDRKCDVWATDPFAGHERFLSLKVHPAPLPDLLGMCDIISLHRPLAEPPDAIVDARALELVKPHALIVNTSRAELVDLSAVAASLASGRLGSAALSFGSDEAGSDDCGEARSPIHTLLANGRLRRLETDFSRHPAVVDRSLKAGLRIIIDYFGGVEPIHRLIDPAFPRILR